MIKKQKLCLAIDTASDISSVALCDTEGRSSVSQMQVSRGQGEALMAMIQDVLEKMKKTPKDLTHIAVAVGPGSFTGVRIGLATARGLGLALHIPVLGVDNFSATAYGLNKNVTIVLDSKRDDYFVQNFDTKGNPLDSPALKTVSQIKKSSLTVCGSGAIKLAQDIKCKVIDPVQETALSIAQIALNTPEKTTEPHPLYLRDADVTI